MIDLMQDTIWTDAEITARTEDYIRERFPLVDELVINRMLWGQALGAYTLNADEQATVAAFQQRVLKARQMGIEWRTGNALLRDVLAYETAQRTLASSEDADEQVAAQAVIDGTGDEAVQLAALRAEAAAARGGE